MSIKGERELWRTQRSIDFLRGMRTAALWLLSPIDRLYLRLSGSERLPPLWLRRHAGLVNKFESSAREAEALIRRLDGRSAGCSDLAASH